MLADAMSLADEESPQSMLVFATLTGAARVALGPDLPAMFTDDERLPPRWWRLGQHRRSGMATAAMAGLRCELESAVADMNNVWEAPFAGVDHGGAVSEALRQAGAAVCAFRSVRLAAGGERARAAGGEPQTARAVFAVLAKELCR